MKRRMSTAEERDVIVAFLGGYTDQLSAISVDRAVQIARKVAKPEVLVDAAIVSRMLERLGFERQPFDRALGVIYRRTPV